MAEHVAGYTEPGSPGSAAYISIDDGFYANQVCVTVRGRIAESSIIVLPVEIWRAILRAANGREARRVKTGPL